MTPKALVRNSHSIPANKHINTPTQAKGHAHKTDTMRAEHPMDGIVTSA